ncbi:MAG: alpha/beta hydrolase-fold protein [Actinomycetota bacterium]
MDDNPPGSTEDGRDTPPEASREPPQAVAAEITSLLDRAEALSPESPDGGVAWHEAVDALRTHRSLLDQVAVTGYRAARLLARSGDPNDLPAVAALAGRANDDGVAEAGPIHAEAVDKLHLFQNRPQPYGTVMVEHQGEIVQPPVDPRTTDEQRSALGLPSLVEMQRRMVDASRRLAGERAATGSLPPGQRFARVWTDPEPVELRARLAAEGASAWADGDVLTFVAESDGPVTVTPVFPIETWSVGDGLQVLQVLVERLDEAIITYTFTPVADPGLGLTPRSFRRGSHDGRFRGRSAPVELPSNDPLVGTTFDHAVESPALGVPRTVTVYRPPDHRAGDDVPVLYATDGNMFAPYARRLDAAIEAGTCPPVVVVAAHAAPMNPIEGNIRALEYLQGFDDARFVAHQRFFTVELVAWAETELGVATDPARRGIFGCSDGAGHALTTSLLNPRAYANTFAYSTGMPPDPDVLAALAGDGGWGADTHPTVHLCAGTLEGGFHQATAAWAGYLHLQGAPHHFTERVAGHDLIQWAEELPRALARAWG